ncbi:MAG: fructosamine kinase family protein [Akkermansiaceae bacterium]|nr:fructosamine kinase family protein [Akkermansiaceae bacterium]MCP5546355.1 fructosamine kinase family protein [Akkermansiaceae bacterium]
MRSEVHQHLEETLGTPITRDHAVGGGCIHDARRVDLADGRAVFVKSGAGTHGDLLVAEARSLRLLSPHIRVPDVLGEGETASGTRWLALEWLDMHPDGDRGRLGRATAGMHGVRADRHGLDHNNFIGATPQANGPMDDWSGFFIERRLKPQLELARRDGHSLPGIRIVEVAADLLANHHPAPALLHGDLWSGNTSFLTDGTPVIFDPAAYFGDPETDLAMLELFGGRLGADFFSGYGPEPEGRPIRRQLYDLYHALNHVHLFGAGYLGMVRRCLQGIGIR